MAQTNASTNLPLTYVDAIGFGYPTVQVSAIGDGTNYGDLTWAGGDSIPTKAELDSWILNETKAIVWKQIQAERDRRKANGVYVSSNWFHTDDTSRIQFLGLVMMGANMPANIMWKTMSGNFVQMTPTLAVSIFQTIAYQDTVIFAAAEQHKAAMWAAATPATYSYSAGWPTTFGE